MSQIRPSLSPLDPPPDGEFAPTADESTYRRRSSWPLTRLANLTLTVLLGVAVAGPVTLPSLRASQWPALLLPAALATLSARVTFEAVDGGARGHGIRSHLVPGLSGALLASLLMAAASLILGLHWSVAIGLATAGLVAATLLGAGAARDFEIKIRLALRRVFFAGSADARRDLSAELARGSDASLVGSTGVQVPVDAGRIIDAVRQSQATVLVVDKDALRVPAVVEAASELNLGGVQVRDLVSYYEAEFKKVPLAELTPAWFLFDIAGVHRRPASQSVRRLFEIGLASILLVLSLPLLIIGWVSVRVTSAGPGFYRQRRVGQGDEPFTLVKLRTMRVSDDTTASWAGAHHHRVTPVGRFLRRLRLDELPQLWNVIRGDLALIGPRPEQVPIVGELERTIPFYSARHSVRPGLTGWAQVNFGYGGSYEGTIAKLQRDLYYIKHRNWRLDALILWLTVKAVLAGPD